MAIPTEEIKLYKSQLNEFINKKFVDNSLLLGFNTVLQSKFQTWIVADLSEYYTTMNAESSSDEIPNNQLETEFQTIKYLDLLWSELHYPMIKFFQRLHANFFNEVCEDFKRAVASGKPNKFKTKPVELRKLNESYLKFHKQIFSYYLNLLKYFSTHYKNSLFPKKFLDHFKFDPPPTSLETDDVTFQSNIIFLCHRCLLALGDISRHRSFLENTYVAPCVSNKDFFKYRGLTSKEKYALLSPTYEKAEQLYKLCIALIPGLSQPYNHLGMINNLLDDKFEACIWFLRSQLTRHTEFRLGNSNLQSVLTKKWFLTRLYEIDFASLATKQTSKNQQTLEDDLNTALACLVGYIYMPEIYKKGPTIVKNITFFKLESDLYKACTDSFEKLILSEDSENYSFFLKQLTFIFSFYALIEKAATADSYDPAKGEDLTTFSKFAFRYIERLFNNIAKLKLSNSNITNVLVCMRLVLNWIKENKSVYRTFSARTGTMKDLSKVVNNIWAYIKELDSSQNSGDTKASQLVYLLRIGSRPVRSYFFSEDLIFKDFEVIKYQFKDFKDDHLFTADNINLLHGDYSNCYNKNGIPSFLSNDVISKLQADSEHGGSLEKEIQEEIKEYEAVSRIKSLVWLVQKLLQDSTAGIQFDFVDLVYVIDPEKRTENRSNKSQNKPKIKNKKAIDHESAQGLVERAAILGPTNNGKKKPDQKLMSDILRESSEKAAQKTSSGRNGSKKESEVISKTDVIREEKATPKVEIPASLAEIESVIFSHTSQLKKVLKPAEDEEMLSPQTDKDNDEVSLLLDSASNGDLNTPVPQSSSSFGSGNQANRLANIWSNKTDSPQSQNAEQFKIPLLQGPNGESDARYTKDSSSTKSGTAPIQLTNTENTLPSFGSNTGTFGQSYNATYAPGAMMGYQAQASNVAFNGGVYAANQVPYPNQYYPQMPMQQGAVPGYASQFQPISQPQQPSYSQHFAQYYQPQQYYGYPPPPPPSSQQPQHYQQPQQQRPSS
ncbi:uncharacterized protein RJT20DRAFT_41018 [Scheffersomyces xylosifermentans]|uniref:uncharacterized protein n=1 Tax=Scheffersomyces xylosifermentans TaxID=1304137 RepID=UPI00315CE439